MVKKKNPIFAVIVRVKQILLLQFRYSSLNNFLSLILILNNKKVRNKKIVKVVIL